MGEVFIYHKRSYLDGIGLCLPKRAIVPDLQMKQKSPVLLFVKLSCNESVMIGGHCRWVQIRTTEYMDDDIHSFWNSHLYFPSSKLGWSESHFSPHDNTKRLVKVRQILDTCSPTELCGLSRYWNVDFCSPTLNVFTITSCRSSVNLPQNDQKIASVICKLSILISASIKVVIFSLPQWKFLHSNETWKVPRGRQVFVPLQISCQDLWIGGGPWGQQMALPEHCCLSCVHFTITSQISETQKGRLWPSGRI